MKKSYLFAFFLIHSILLQANDYRTIPPAGAGL